MFAKSKRLCITVWEIIENYVYDTIILGFVLYIVFEHIRNPINYRGETSIPNALWENIKMIAVWELIALAILIIIWIITIIRRANRDKKRDEVSRDLVGTNQQLVERLDRLISAMEAKNDASNPKTSG